MEKPFVRSFSADVLTFSVLLWVRMTWNTLLLCFWRALHHHWVLHLISWYFHEKTIWVFEWTFSYYHLLFLMHFSTKWFECMTWHSFCKTLKICKTTGYSVWVIFGGFSLQIVKYSISGGPINHTIFDIFN